jgi:hypothetical protein
MDLSMISNVNWSDIPCLMSERHLKDITLRTFHHCFPVSCQHWTDVLGCAVLSRTDSRHWSYHVFPPTFMTFEALSSWTAPTLSSRSHRHSTSMFDQDETQGTSTRGSKYTTQLSITHYTCRSSAKFTARRHYMLITVQSISIQKF